MTETVNRDLRLVCLAALAWLHEHDYSGHHAEGMDAEIDPGELAAVVDRLTDSGEAGSETSVLIEKMADALSVAADYFNARDEMNAAVHTPSDVRLSPITVMVNEAMEAWRGWRFG